MADHNGEIFERLRAIENSNAQTNGQLKTMIEQNQELIRLLRSSLRYAFGVIILLILALIYGALGEKGFNAVKSISSNGVASAEFVVPQCDIKVQREA